MSNSEPVKFPVDVDLDALTLDELKRVALGELTRRAKISQAKKGVLRGAAHRERIREGVIQSWARRKAAAQDVSLTEGR